MKRRLLSIVLVAAMVLSVVPTVAAADTGLTNFGPKRTYTQGQFADVADDSWYTDSIKDAYEFALVEGKGDGRFEPNAYLKLSEALTLACRLCDIYNGGDGTFEEGSPWYQVYVDYAIEHGMISAGDYSDYNAYATRAQFAEIIEKAFPEDALPAINSIAMGSLPDVPETASYAGAVYRLYNAGILAGNDDYGSFNPDGNIRRSAVATIMIRMADADSREKLNLKEKPVDVTGISLNVTAASLETGKTQTLTATVSPDNATDKTVTWSSSNAAVASVSDSGTVTGVAAGSAVITAKAGNFSATCNVTVTLAPITYSGTGDKVITGVNLPAGSYYAEYTHTGKRNFISKLYYGSESYNYFLISNEIGNCSGQVALYKNGNAEITDGTLEVKAGGAWTITFKPVSGTTTTNITGHGQTVTGIFTATTARNVVTLTHNGSSNFIVQVIKYNGTKSYDYESVTNEIGVYSGQKVVNLTVGAKYYIYVRADGDWTIDFGSGNSGTQGGSSSTELTATEASNLNSYANDAASNCSTALNYVTQALRASSKALKLTYLQEAVMYAERAKSYEQKAVDILTSHETLVCTDGISLLEKAQDAVDYLDTVASVTPTLDTFYTSLSTVNTNLTLGSAKCAIVLSEATLLLQNYVK